jgi:hypothetical protein
MKITRILGLVLVAVFALSAVAAASASAAEPAFYECAKEAGGKYEKGCAKEGGKGGYVLREGIGKNHTLKGKSGKAKLETPGVGAVECSSSKSTGTVTGPKNINKIVVEYKGCTSNGKKCNSTGAKAGTIKTNTLKGEIGYIEGGKAAHEVGADIKPESGTNLAEFECEGVKIETYGSVIGRVKPVNTFSKTSELIFKGTSGGGQEIKKLEGQPEDTLHTNFVGIASGLSSYQEQTTVNKGEDLEVKA